jgi:(p)ppGpp synthase/HD superfamily hydrolase
VEACTDTPVDYKGGAKPPWRDRKTAYLAHIKSGDPRARRVALADKLDNARAILADHRQVGDQLWSRFNSGKEDQLWFYRSVASAFREAGAVGFLIDELEDVVTQLERTARGV